MLMPKKSSTESFKDWRPDPGLFGLPQHLSHLSGSHLVFPRLYTCVAYMGSILVYLPLLFSLLSFSSFIKNPFSRKPHELKNRLWTKIRPQPGCGVVTQACGPTLVLCEHTRFTPIPSGPLITHSVYISRYDHSGGRANEI